MNAARPGVWPALAEDVPHDALRFRQDGKVQKGKRGDFLARFVVYIDAGFVRRRLDEVVPGQWTLRLRPLPARDIVEKGGEVTSVVFAFVARLRICGVVREAIGEGHDYKAAETDAFKRAAARFGIGQSLKVLPQIWVPMDGDGKYAKPSRPPIDVYEERRRGRSAA